MKLNVALVGLGYWGKNLLRNIVADKLTGDVFLCDSNSVRIDEAMALYKFSEVYLALEDVLSNQQIDCVVIATPTSSHYTIAARCLKAGKHVLVEKPITTSATEAEELIKIATAKQKILMVDHVYLYHPAVKKLKDCIDNYATIGRINYIDSTRINLGIYQEDVNVLWDLACHDVSIVNYLIAEKPTAVRAIGRLNPWHGVEDLSYMFLHYPSGLLVQVNSSWSSPVKIRNMIIGGEKQMIIYDDIEPTNKITIYDYEANIKPDENKIHLKDYRLGNVTLPKYEPEEALTNVIHAFYLAIINQKPPLSDGENGLNVVKILESAQKSLTLGGALIELT